MRLRIALLLATLLAGCTREYSDLEKTFASAKQSEAPSISADTVEFVSVYRRGGIFTFKHDVTIRLSKNSIQIEPPFPWKTVTIPSESVSGCSKTCGLGWEANILVAITGTEISVPESNEIIEWCWKNHLPMVSGRDRREWLYHRVTLPLASTYKQQLASRELYDRQAKSSCVGY